MGLLDILNGMQNGPRGPAAPSTGGMSPITKAILALLAYKALGKIGGATAAPNPAPSPTPAPTSPGMPDLGNLGGLLTGGLGGILGGALTGGALSGGLNDLLKKFQDTGHGDIAKSWVGTGPNRDIADNDLARSIGLDDIDALVRHTGVPRQELVSTLAQELPSAIDQFTPDGRVPSADEMSRLMNQSEGA